MTTPIYIDPNCSKNLADKYCEKLDAPIMKYLFDDSQIELPINKYGNEKGCKLINKYYQCLQLNFRIKCSQTLSKTLAKIETINGKCVNSNSNNKVFLSKNNSEKKVYSNIVFLNAVCIFFGLFLFS
jgi:hypothetical protein